MISVYLLLNYSLWYLYAEIICHLCKPLMFLAP